MMDKIYGFTWSVLESWKFWCVAWVIVVGLFFLSGCSEECSVNETRCNGQVVQVCNSDGKWDDSMNCRQVSVGELEFVCKEDPEDGLHSCLLRDEIVDDGGMPDIDGGK